MNADEPISDSLEAAQINWRELHESTNGTLLHDRFRLRRWLNRIKKAKKLDDSQLRQWQQKLAQAKEQFEWRDAQSFHPKFDKSLPIYQHVESIQNAIEKHQVIIVCGETGSGKSTQLPLIALQAGYARKGLIGHTQPRRIAARSIAARIASQMKTKVGDEVGFKIRFHDQSNPQTHIKLMTDGILLAETQTDRFLNQYSLLIVDEAHERSLNIDFLLGNLKRILLKRPDLRLIITSATIDTERFAEHFCDANNQPAPVFNIEGRTYPVETRYEPIPEENDEITVEPIDWLVERTLNLHQQETGDILVFLPTEQDIRVTHKKLRGELNRLGLQKVDVLPLYARLSTESQNAIFNPEKNRRIVLATNVAESSVTVPRISCVVDSGTARISRYSPRNKVQRLPIEPVSQASANQRAGRCGRIGPGTCLRLYSEEDFKSRAEYTTPEIRRTNLASVILQAKLLKLGEIETFPFIDPPRADAIRDGYKTLYEIKAVNETNELTPLGRKMGKIPVDPRISRMLFSAEENGCLAEILIIASALEIQDPRLRPADKQKSADEQHAKFADPESDFLTLLKIWDFFHELKDSLSRSKLQKACAQNFLSYSLLRQWQQLHHQLKTVVRDSGLSIKSRENKSDSIHRSLLTGYLSGIAMLSDKFEYTGAHGIKFRLWPGSNVFKAKPKWILVAELVETSHRYGRTVARINPAWIEPLAKHLVKSNFTQPHWSTKRETVMAHERVSLFGLPVVASRRTPFGKIDQPVSRDIFIEKALVEREMKTQFDFTRHNDSLLESAKSLADKTRNRDFVVDPYRLISFFQERVPEDVFDVESVKRATKQDQNLAANLKLSMEDVFPELESDKSVPTDELETTFPDHIQLNASKLPVTYKYAPGDQDDGATVRIPKMVLGQIDDSQSPWLIPGLIESRIIGLIRSLPKPIRRNLVPAPDTAHEVAKAIVNETGDFHSLVAEQLTRIGQTEIDAGMFRLEKIDSYLKPNFQVVDDEGETLDKGRSIADLRIRMSVNRESMIDDGQLAEQVDWKGEALTDWTWDKTPESLVIQKNGVAMEVFPAIQDQGENVSLCLLDSRYAAKRQTEQGLVRLFQIRNRKNIKSQVNWLPDLEKHGMLLASLFASDDLKKSLATLIARVAFVDHQPECTTREEFDRRQDDSGERIAIATTEVAKWLPKMAHHYHQVKLAIGDLSSKFEATRVDLNEQLSNLTSESFIQTTPWNWLKHFPRFLEAMLTRIDKRPTLTNEKDRELTDSVRRFEEMYLVQAEAHLRQGITDPELDHFRWMLEEFRVSLFAQQLGTSITISAKRLEKHWKKVRIAVGQ